MYPAEYMLQFFKIEEGTMDSTMGYPHRSAGCMTPKRAWTI